MASSPAEFLTFYRRLATSQGFKLTAVRPNNFRSFHATTAVKATGHPDDKEHATRKGDSLDVQSREVKHGTQSKSTDTGGHATREKDESKSVSKAKQEHPEAPDPAIGMQDERGGKNV